MRGRRKNSSAPVNVRGSKEAVYGPAPRSHGPRALFSGKTQSTMPQVNYPPLVPQSGSDQMIHLVQRSGGAPKRSR